MKLSAFVSILALVGCASDPLPLCTPGQTSVCACPDGGSGAQICLSDGSRFGTCLCDEAPPGPACGGDSLAFALTGL